MSPDNGIYFLIKLRARGEARFWRKTWSFLGTNAGFLRIQSTSWVCVSPQPSRCASQAECHLSLRLNFAVQQPAFMLRGSRSRLRIEPKFRSGGCRCSGDEASPIRSATGRRSYGRQLRHSGFIHSKSCFLSPALVPGLVIEVFSRTSIFEDEEDSLMPENNKSRPDLAVEPGQMGDGSSPCSLSRAGIRRALAGLPASRRHSPRQAELSAS